MKNIHPFSYLIFGTVMLMFSNGNRSIPVAAWLFSVFFIRFFRTRNTVAGLVSGAVLLISAYIFIALQMLDFEALSMKFRIASGIASGLIFLMPFLSDRFFAPRIKGNLSTLVFPCTWVSIEYLSSQVNGTWYSLAYTQYGNLPLMQMASLTGIWGLSFLITWFASVVNFYWENDFDISKSGNLAITYLSITAMVLFYGGARLCLSDSSSETVKAASLQSPNKSFVSIFFQSDSKTGGDSVRAKSAKELQDLIRRSSDAAKQGAKLVFWQEYAVTVLAGDEASLIRQGSELAKQEGIYLVMAYAVLPLGFPDKPWINKLIWMDPRGKVLREYFKSKPAPPLEPIKPGNGIVPVIDTSYGKIASVICADQNYPGLVRQAGKSGAGLLLVPSLDWKAVSPLHTQMGIFRAIENGFSMIKGTGEGMSAAVDPMGRILSALHYWDTDEKTMFAEVPVKHLPTLYVLIGDAFAWLCISGWLTIILMIVVKKRNAGI